MGRLHPWLARLQPMLGVPWLRRVWEGLNLLWKLVLGLGAFAGAILAIVGLIALVDGGDGPPPSLDGEITKIKLEQRQTLGDYCRDTYTGGQLGELPGPAVPGRARLPFLRSCRPHRLHGPMLFPPTTRSHSSSLQSIPGFVRVPAVANVTPEGIDDVGGWWVWVGNPSVRNFDLRFVLDKTSGGNLDSDSIRKIPV